MVVIELAGDASLPRDLAAGGVFVPDCELRLSEECDLVVCGASHQLMIPARVVYVDPQGGAGLELLGFSPEMMAQLAELATPTLPESAPPTPELEGVASGSSTEMDAWSESSAADPRSASGAPGAPDHDDLAIPGAIAVLTPRDAAAFHNEAGILGDGTLGDGGNDDLAIPVSTEDAYAATMATSTEASLRSPGDAVFAYAKPGRAYRGGVARRAESEAGDDGAASRGAGVRRRAESESGDDGAAPYRGGVARRAESETGNDGAAPYRGGVARRAEVGDDGAAPRGADVRRPAESEAGDDGAAPRGAAARPLARPVARVLRAKSEARGLPRDGEVDAVSALVAELDAAFGNAGLADAELGIADLADADFDPDVEQTENPLFPPAEPLARGSTFVDDAAAEDEQGLELELIGPAAVTAARWAEAARGSRAGTDADANLDDAAWAHGEGGEPGDTSGDHGVDGERDADQSDMAGDGDGAGELDTTGDGDATGHGELGASRRAGVTRQVARNVNERLRGLTLAVQIKMATQGELHERIVLERLYGKNVWETLLRNPRLTAPEVSRIARYGSLPRILLEIIVGNNAWLQIPEVRRALLSNPRLGVDQIMKVLRLTPKHELRLAAIQTAYPHAVRNAAKMLMRGES
jgi:hypothetical protein